MRESKFSISKIKPILKYLKVKENRHNIYKRMFCFRSAYNRYVIFVYGSLDCPNKIYISKVFHSIQETCTELLKIVEKYQLRLNGMKS